MKRVQNLGLAIALAAGVSACQTTEAEEPSLQTVAVERGDLRIVAEAVGSIEPVRRVEVKSKASGEILALHVDVGDFVETGALLAEVDPRDVKNRYDQAMADLNVSEAQAANAETQLRRSEELHGAGIITDQELESSRLSFTNSQANLTRSRTNFELAALQLEDVTIRAPMDGTILQKNVEEGTVIQSASGSVSGGTALFVMASLGEMQVRTLIDEVDIGQLRPGLPTTVTVQAFPGRAFQGFVQQIEPEALVQQNVTKFPVIISLDNSEGLLRPGMNGDVQVLVDEVTDALIVDNAAIIMPQDALPAALALGLAETALESLNAPAQGRTEAPVGEGEGAPAPAGEGAPAPAEGAAAQQPGQTPEGGQAAPGGRQGGGRAFGGGRRGGGGGGAALGQRGGQGQGGGGQRTVQRAVVFVVDAAGVVTPRAITIGLSDWVSTQVLSGLEEGDQIALVGAAQLEAQREATGGRGLTPFGGPQIRIGGGGGGGGGGRGGF